MYSFLFFKKLIQHNSIYDFNKYWLKSLIKYTEWNSSFTFLYTNYTINKLYRNYINIITIYFFRKEIFYTKLKYSRVPQFDVSATGVASFLSAAVGVLICEKTGFELLDGGDFLYIILYIFIISWSLIHLVRLLNSTTFLLSFFYIFSLTFR